MKVSIVLAALLGLVNAKVHLTNSNFDDIEAGSTFQITWDDAEGPVTLTLKNGPSDDLDDVQTITTNASGGSFVWSVDPALAAGDYAIEIDDGTDVNYSQMFPVDSTVEPTSSSASSSASITRSTASPSSTSTSESSSAESTSTESSSTESTTSSESSTVTSSAETTSTTASSSSVTRTTSSAATSTESDAAQTSVPNSNDARSMAAPLVPGILAILGAALI